MNIVTPLKYPPNTSYRTLYENNTCFAGYNYIPPHTLHDLWYRQKGRILPLQVLLVESKM